MRKRLPLHLVIVAAVHSVGWGAWSSPLSLSFADQPQPRFRSGVEVVEVAALARDRQGRPVTDLTESEITITEDGVPQQIVGFQRVSIPVVQPLPAAGSSLMRAAPDVSSNERIAEARVYVLVLDALHIAPGRNGAVRHYARQFVEQYVAPGDLAAVISPGAVAEATQDFTGDTALLLAAIDRFTGTKVKSYTQERSDLGFGSRREKEGMGSDSERAHRVFSLADSLEALARHLDRIQGQRKALLLFSEGIDYDTGDVTAKYQRYASEVTHAMARAVGALMHTNTVLYTMDPRGLSTAQGDLVEDPIHEIAPGDPEFVSERDFVREVERSVWSLRDLARATGGFLATDKGFSRAFREIAEENSDYYMIRYAPAKPAKPGTSRRLHVRVSRRGVTIVARRGYTVPRTEARRTSVDPVPELDLPQRGMPRSGARMNQPATASAPVSGVPADLATLLASPLPKAGLPIRVQAIPFRAGGRKAGVQLVVEVLGGGLQFGNDRGRAEERLELALLTVDSRGRAENGRSTTVELRLPAADVERVKATGVRWLSRLELSPGQHQIRVAGRAMRTGATGLVTHTVDVPRFAPGDLSMSGVTLTSLVAVLMPTRGKAWLEQLVQTPPAASRVFVAGDRVTAAVELYSPATFKAAPQVIGHVETVAGEQVLTLSRTIQAESRSSSGTNQVAFHIETGKLPPGHYVLRLIARAGAGDPVERLVPLEVVPPESDPGLRRHTGR